MRIKFSHQYPKLVRQSTAELLAVKLMRKDQLHPDLVGTDTIYFLDSGDKQYYPLPNGWILILIFLGDKNIPFTTIRRSTAQKQAWYESKIGERFDIVVEEEKPDAVQISAELTA